MAFDIKAAVAQAAQNTDMNKSVKGGGDYTPPALGTCMLRLIGYIETGKHENRIPGKPAKVDNCVEMVFELSGPNHAPKVADDGTVYPHRLTVRTSLSLNEKANFFKLFKRMNYDGTAKHMAELLGKPFLGTVVHKTTGEGADKKTYANLKDDGGFTIRPPMYDDPISGQTTVVPVPEPISPIRCFLWDYASQEMWDSLFIDGAYDDGKTKNVIQAKIMSALNWEGSAMWNILRSGGAVPDVPSGEGKPSADPLVQAAVQSTQVAAANPAQAATASPSNAAADPLAGMA